MTNIPAPAHKDDPDSFWLRMKQIHGVEVESAPIKLWHDDIRRPPSPEWQWARTNKDAKRVLTLFNVVEISMDHDLGMDGIDPDLPDAIYLKGNSEETGLDLVDWMIERCLVPEKVTVHSWNPSGADRMVRTLRAHGYRATYIPYEPPQAVIV